MRKLHIGILGASGAVGQELVNILLERDIPMASLRLLGSARSAGQTLCIGDTLYTIIEATPQSFVGLDVVFGAVEADIARLFAPAIQSSGALFIDNSSAFRQDPNVPLVVPEVNAHVIPLHQGIISNPNCSTILAMVALAPLHAVANLDNLIVTTFQAVSGAGVQGLSALYQEEQHKTTPNSVFPYPIARNVIPWIGEGDYELTSSEELKMVQESQKILAAPQLQVHCTCVRVPVERSHALSLHCTFDKECSVQLAKDVLLRAPGVLLTQTSQEPPYPMPLYTSNQDLVFVGRIRQASNNPKQLSLFISGDQVRKGAATNAIQILEAWMHQQQKEDQT
ncbi:MAG: aspartate-semialdehyde dehydrogenase [Erysipelotrichaceae bacterium]